ALRSLIGGRRGERERPRHVLGQRYARQDAKEQRADHDRDGAPPPRGSTSTSTLDAQRTVLRAHDVILIGGDDIRTRTPRLRPRGRGFRGWGGRGPPQPRLRGGQGASDPAASARRPGRRYRR